MEYKKIANFAPMQHYAAGRGGKGKGIKTEVRGGLRRSSLNHSLSLVYARFFYFFARSLAFVPSSVEPRAGNHYQWTSAYTVYL